MECVTRPQTPPWASIKPVPRVKLPKVRALQPTPEGGILISAQTRFFPRQPMSAPTNVEIPHVPDNSSSWNEFPSDTLLEVVSYLRDDRYTLLGLTRVCSYWRRVVIECPLNWTQISTTYPQKLVKLWLQRSRNVPVDAEIFHVPPGLYGQFPCPWIVEGTNAQMSTGPLS